MNKYVWSVLYLSLFMDDFVDLTRERDIKRPLSLRFLHMDWRVKSGSRGEHISWLLAEHIAVFH